MKLNSLNSFLINGKGPGLDVPSISKIIRKFQQAAMEKSPEKEGIG
jgi:hypothetical protein